MQEIHTAMSSFPRSHRRKDSSELDVFEATQYFSGKIDVSEVGSHRAMRGKSLDVPMEAKLPYHYSQRVGSNHVKEKIKCKQPRSPGGKLASFLNSFFQQYSSSKKKKKKSKAMKGEEEEEEEENYAGRKRRSSISHSQSIRSSDSKPFYHSSSGSSGFRTPSLYTNKREAWDEKVSDGFVEKRWELNRSTGEGGVWGDHEFISKEKGFRREVEEQEDGGESDSSSDLFELKINYDFGDSSSGLPVYASTDMEVIKRGVANIASVAF